MKTYIIRITLLFMAFFTGCSQDYLETPASIPYKKLAEGYAPGAATKVEIYAADSLTTGYNALYLALYDSVSGQPLTTAGITLLPMMNMETKKHAAPVENPDFQAAESGLFPAAVVFTMPSRLGSWTLDVLMESRGKSGKLSVPLLIREPPATRVKSFVSKADSAKIIVAYLQPAAPKVGINDLEVAIYRMKSMMDFPADSSLQVVLTPEMPTMGHGSPNNVHPVHVSRGHYKGKVNFTMTGLWYTHLDFYKGTVLADSTTFFEVNF